RAPSETGLYEVRYVLNEGRRTLATTMIEITEPEVTVSAPETALTGEAFAVSWSGTVSGNDFVTIVPAGAEEGEIDNHARVRDKTDDQLRAPSETGLYEVRYVLNEGRRTLATAMIEITEPEVTVSAPETLRASDDLKVSWTGAVSGNDMVTIVPMGAADKEIETHIRVRDNTEGTLRAPEQPGLYEVRYVLNEGRVVLARASVEILDADAPLSFGATLTAPDSAAAGETIEIEWQVEERSADQRIALAEQGKPLFTWAAVEKITDDGPVRLTLPDESGVYELRLLDISNRKVLARQVIELR
ncbi:Ca-activated chloride channel family protein, partial [Salinihabitans flavidus]